MGRKRLSYYKYIYTTPKIQALSLLSGANSPHTYYCQFMFDAEVLVFGMTNSVYYQFKKILDPPESNSWQHSLEQPLAKVNQQLPQHLCPDITLLLTKLVGGLLRSYHPQISTSHSMFWFC